MRLPSMHVRIAALPDEECPKCHAFNLEQTADRAARVHIWRVADERGSHFQCKCCTHVWTVIQNTVVATANRVRP